MLFGYKMNYKNIFRDLTLFFGSLLLNILFIFFFLKFLNNINELLLNIIYEKSLLDDLLKKIHLFSLNGIFLLSFCYFIYLDIQTVFSRKDNEFCDSKADKNLTFGQKEFINKAYNLYNRVPIEYSLYQAVKIYLKRLLLILMIMSPFYISSVVLYLLLIAPTLTSAIILFTLLSMAFLYLYDFTVVKKIGIYCKNFINRFVPDRKGPRRSGKTTGKRS